MEDDLRFYKTELRTLLYVHKYTETFQGDANKLALDEFLNDVAINLADLNKRLEELSLENVRLRAHIDFGAYLN